MLLLLVAWQLYDMQLNTPKSKEMILVPLARANLPLLNCSLQQLISLTGLLPSNDLAFILIQLCPGLFVLTLWFTKTFASYLEYGGQIDVMYSDFEKAFDKVPHNRLINKLKSYGFDNVIIMWIQIF